VGRDSFYGFLASHRTELFHDEDFTDLYCSYNGRPSVPPSLMATALLLQAYEGVSDEESKAQADFDLRWKVALGIALEERPFAKSTLQLFRARLILHERVRTLFGQSLAFARRTGYFRTRKLKVVLDTTHILGRGAVKGYVQPAGRRDHQAGTCISHRDPLQPGGVGAGARPEALFRLVS
jgi:transposase